MCEKGFIVFICSIVSQLAVSVPLKIILLHVLVWSCFLIPSAVIMKNEVSRDSITSVLMVIPESVMSCQLNWLHHSLVLPQQLHQCRQCPVNLGRQTLLTESKSCGNSTPHPKLSPFFCAPFLQVSVRMSPEIRDFICFLHELQIPSSSFKFKFLQILMEDNSGWSPTFHHLA